MPPRVNRLLTHKRTAPEIWIFSDFHTTDNNLNISRNHAPKDYEQETGDGGE